MEKKSLYISFSALFLVGVLCSINLAQYFAKSEDSKPKEKPIVTSAALSVEEIAEGKGILADAKNLSATREASTKVISEPPNKKNTKARLDAYEAWWTTTKSLEELQAKVNRLIARAQERTGCKDCGIDLEKGMLTKEPAKN